MTDTGTRPVVIDPRLPPMWRDVYRKASDLAHGIAAGLVRQHFQEVHVRRSALVIVLDGGGSAITTGIKADIEIPHPYEIVGWTLYADQADTFQLDLRTAPDYAGYETGATSICADAKPYLDATIKNRSEDLPMTGWTTTLATGSSLRVVVELVGVAELATLTLLLRSV